MLLLTSIKRINVNSNLSVELKVTIGVNLVQYFTFLCDYAIIKGKLRKGIKI